MSWLDNVLKSAQEISAKANTFISTASSVAGKIKGLSIPSIQTVPNVPAGVEMTSESAPGKLNAYTEKQKGSMQMFLLIGVAVALAIYLLRK